jgi:GNAT superfamily N-acetyltransferase
MDTHFVVIRPFRREDHASVLQLIQEATLDPVNTFFFRTLTREIFFQAVIMIAAIMYILCGVPLQFTVSALPLTTVLAYIVIWFAHWYKAKYLHKDIVNVMKTYLGSDKTSFFVAEAFFNPIDSKFLKQDKPGFITETEFENLDKTGNVSNNRTLTRELVGCIGVMRAKESAVLAWLRRTGVKKTWRGKGVGGALVDRVIKHCSQKGFIGIELVTTECHDSARKLYERKGFEVRAFYHKKFFKMSQASIMMLAMHYKTRPYKETTINL